MRVCFFIPSFGDGGAQRQCIGLLNVLQHDPALEVHLILLGAGEHDDSLDLTKLHVHRIQVSDFANPVALAFVIRTLHRIRPDVLLSWLQGADIWSYVATRIVRGIPWLIAERDSAYPDELVFRLRKRFGRRAAAAVIANSEPGKQLWDPLPTGSPVYVIPNMVITNDHEHTGRAAADRTTSVDCLSVGRIEPQKNIGAMVSAFTQFANVHPHAELKIVGKGRLTDLAVQIATDGGVGGRLTMLGFRRDIPDLMASARVFLTFSKHEGMPNVLMEAVAAGLPSVVSDIPEHRALLGDDYPYYVSTDASSAEGAAVIAQAWEHGIADVEQIYSHARSVLANLTPEKVAKAYIDVFAEVIATKAVSGRGHSRWRRR